MSSIFTSNSPPSRAALLLRISSLTSPEPQHPVDRLHQRTNAHEHTATQPRPPRLQPTRSEASIANSRFPDLGLPTDPNRRYVATIASRCSSTKVHPVNLNLALGTTVRANSSTDKGRNATSSVVPTTASAAVAVATQKTEYWIATGVECDLAF
jgi:hypothetical protein